jgi:WD40 repeat protein
MRRGVFLFLVYLAAGDVSAEQITTAPLQFYGLGTLTCAAWSPDGKQIVTGGSAGAFLWDVATSHVIRMFIGQTRKATLVAFSPDGIKVRSDSGDRTVPLSPTLAARNGSTLTGDRIILAATGVNYAGRSAHQQSRMDHHNKKGSDKWGGDLASRLNVTGDAYEVDDTATSATEYIFSSVPEFPASQRHNFHDAGDADWVKFYGRGGFPYTLWVDDPGTSCDAVIELYDSTTATAFLAQEDHLGFLPYILPTTKTYYWKVYNFNSAIYGEGTSYTVRLTDDWGANNGLAIALGSSALRCSWDPGLQPGDHGFNLHRTTLAEMNWTKVNSSPITATTYDDSGLQPSTEYLYFVRVKKGDGSEPLWTGVFCGTTSPPGECLVSFDVATSSVSEGVGTARVRLHLSEPSAQPVTVNYSVGGTATPGVDFGALPGNVTFGAYATQTSITVTITNDTLDEPDEMVIVTLTGATNATLDTTKKQHTLTIRDNDRSTATRWSHYR